MVFINTETKKDLIKILIISTLIVLWLFLGGSLRDLPLDSTIVGKNYSNNHLIMEFSDSWDKIREESTERKSVVEFARLGPEEDYASLEVQCLELSENEIEDWISEFEAELEEKGAEFYPDIESEEGPSEEYEYILETNQNFSEIFLEVYDNLEYYNDIEVIRNYLNQYSRDEFLAELENNPNALLDELEQLLQSVLNENNEQVTSLVDELEYLIAKYETIGRWEFSNKKRISFLVFEAKERVLITTSYSLKENFAEEKLVFDEAVNSIEVIDPNENKMEGWQRVFIISFFTSLLNN